MIAVGTDEDLFSLHDSSDDEYNITDDENYFDDTSYKTKEPKTISNFREKTNTTKMQAKRTDKGSYKKVKKLDTSNEATRINLISNEEERLIETNLARVLVMTPAQQNDIKNNDDSINDPEVTEIHSEMWLCFNDTVLVRYYQRAPWKYYIGFIEDIRTEEGNSYFTIRFLKTVKKPTLRFVVQKLRDVDTVTENSIIKRIEITQNTERPKEYFLAVTSDEVYFE